MARTVSVKIVGDPGNFRRAFADSGKEISRFGATVNKASSTAIRGLGMLAKAGAAAAAAIGVGFAAVVMKGVKSLVEHEKASAQTTAALKSTGDAAGVTRKQIEGLADAIEKTTGVDDLAVQSAQNLLLTFCLEEAAEALTMDRGWVHHNELRAGDWILGYDPEDDSAKWELVDSVHRFSVDGVLTRWRSKQIDVATTPHHRWWTTGRTTAGGASRMQEYRFRTTEEITGHQYAVKIGGGRPAGFAERPVYSNELVELVGWVVTEGWAHWLRPSTPHQNGAGFTQSESANPENVARIRRLVATLRSQGHEVSESVVERDAGCGTGVAVAMTRASRVVQWTFGKSLGKAIKSVVPEKKLTPALLSSLTAEQAELLLETLLLADGSVDRSGARQFIQKDEDQLGIVAMLCAMLGIRTTVLGRGDSLYLCRTNHVWGSRTNAVEERYRGIVWCPHLRTGIFMARCNGRTFWTGNTNVRNEVGKGNDVFTQATKTIVDMSVALGQDTSSSAIQLGKALNDPIKGITALTRVGVSFTQAQKDQIKALVEAGDVMGAQKIILTELNKEFGGSAEAAGKTFGGQIEILKAKLEEFSEGVGKGVLPTLRKLTGVTKDVDFGKLGDDIGKKVGGALAVAADAAKKLWDQLQKFRNAPDKIEFLKVNAVELGNKLKAGLDQAIEKVDWNAVGQKLSTQINSLWGRLDFGMMGQAVGDAFKQVDWEKVGSMLIEALGAAFDAVADIGIGLLKSLADPGFWAKNWDVLLNIALLAFPVGKAASMLGRLFVRFGDDIARAIGGWGPAIMSGLAKVGDWFVSGLKTAFGKIPGLVTSLFRSGFIATISQGLQEVGSTLTNAAQTLWTNAQNVGRKIVDGLKNGVTGIVERVTEFFQKIPPAIAGFADRVWNAAKNLGGRILEGIAHGVTGLVAKVQEKFQDLWGWIKGAASSAATYAAQVGRAIVQGIWDGIQGLAGWVKDKIAAWAGGLLDGALGALGIGSPSKVAAEKVGKPIAQGVAEGIDQGGAEVDKALRRLANRVTAQIESHGRTIQAAVQRWFNFTSVGGAHETSGLSGYPALDFMGGGPVRMPFAATITRTSGHPGYSGGFGGRSIYFTDERGVRYFMTHLDWNSSAQLAGMRGQTIPAGTLLANSPESGAGHIHVGSTAGAPSWLQSGGMVPDMGRMTAGVSAAMETLASRVKATMEKIGSMFSSMKDRALAAFDRITEGYVAPSRRLLEENQRTHDELLRQEEKAAIQRRINEATNEEERQAALRDMREFEFQENQRALEEKAQQEEEAWQKSREKERGRLEKDLERWIKHLGNKNTTTKTAMKELREIFHRAGLDADDGFMNGIGGLLGKLKKLIQDMKSEVAAGAGEISGAAAGAAGGQQIGQTAAQAAAAIPAATGSTGVGQGFNWGGKHWGPGGGGKGDFISFMQDINGNDWAYATWAAAHPAAVAAAGWARGGIASRPTFGVFGEAGREALVPLEGAMSRKFARSKAGAEVSAALAAAQEWVPIFPGKPFMKRRGPKINWSGLIGPGGLFPGTGGSVSSATGGAGSPLPGASSATLAGAAGRPLVVNVHVNVEGNVWKTRELAREIRDALISGVGQANGRVGLA